MENDRVIYYTHLSTFECTQNECVHAQKRQILSYYSLTDGQVLAKCYEVRLFILSGITLQ